MEPPTPPADRPATPPHDVRSGPDADLSGRVLDDYKVLRRIGQGGMGQVYLAEQLSLRRQVALKILRAEPEEESGGPGGKADTDAGRALARFKGEAEAVARATHANIVQIYQIGRAGGVDYMALEYVEGRNLREFVEKKKPISVAAGLKIMSQVAAALARADELKIVHRDIKPENILISRKGEVKVADFGLSRRFDRNLNLTASGVVMGTPLYMSPEQVDRKRPVDHRSDLYALGATSYFMFAGRPPFRGDSPIEVAYQHVHRDPDPLAECRPDLPADLCAIIHRLMAKQPEDRYQTARELARDLARLREQILVTSTLSALTPSGSLPAPPEGAALGAPRRAPRRAPRPTRRGRYLGIASVLLALGGGVALGWYRKQPPEPEPGPAPPPVAPAAADDLGAARALFSVREREKQLRSQIKENYQPHGPLSLKVVTGLNAAVDLGLLYLGERRLDDADALFKDLCPAAEKKCPGRLLSQIGQAIVLALRDQAAESNQQFLALAAEFDKLEKLLAFNPGAKLGKGIGKEWLAHKDEVEIYHLLWKNSPPAASLREMVARALDANYANDPKGFPPRLEAYRHPPRPVVKGPPPG